MASEQEGTMEVMAVVGAAGVLLKVNDHWFQLGSRSGLPASGGTSVSLDEDGRYGSLTETSGR